GTLGTTPTYFANHLGLLYNQALPIRRSVGDRALEAVTLNNIGAVNNRSQPPTRTNIPPIPK
ncbi:hypothetical protein QT971_11770, partial [Microcoleus sp. herbarium19]